MKHHLFTTTLEDNNYPEGTIQISYGKSVIKTISTLSISTCGAYKTALYLYKDITGIEYKDYTEVTGL